MKLKALLGFALLASSAFAATISTGAGGVNWMVNGNPAVIETGTLPIFPGGWISAFGDGQWVGTSATDGNYSAPGAGAPANGATYTFTLNLGSIIAAGGSFTLQYASDNAINWTISGGGTLGGTTSCGSGNMNADCFSTARSLNGTFTSTSILTATVINGPAGSGERSPMGLLVVGSATDVPEPSTYAMLTLGGAAIAFARLRRK